MSFPALKAAEEKLEAKQKELKSIFDEAGPEMDTSKVKSVTGDVVDHIRSLNAELDEAGAEVKKLREVAKAAEAANVDHGFKQSGDDKGVKDGRREPSLKGTPWEGFDEGVTIGDLFVESAAYKGRKSGGQGAVATLDGIGLKTLMTTSAGWATQPIRTGKVVDLATRPVQITDIVPQTTTTQSAIVYMEETTFTNSAAEASEGGTYAESALALTERTSTVRKIATFLPVTDEQLEDIDQARGYVNNRLPFMLKQRLDGQILSGDGSAPNLRGVLNASNLQTQAKGTDPAPDAIYKAMVKVRVTGRAMPDYVILHPTDWQNIRLLRTADGVYVWGSPSETGPAMIWGLPVVQCDAGSAGTAVVGDWGNYSELSVKRGIEVQVSNSHSTYFIEGKNAVRADMRAALVFYRGTAFCQITGL